LGQAGQTGQPSQSAGTMQTNKWIAAESEAVLWLAKKQKKGQAGSVEALLAEFSW